MKIDLEASFKDKWRKGYLRTSKDDQRSRVDLFNSNSDRTTISYARYKKSVELGEELSKDVEVDHYDRNKSNDDLNNLQILSKEAHKAKTKIEVSGRNTVTLICVNCQKSFEREVYNVTTHNDNINFFCSRSCNAKFYFPNGPKGPR